MSDFQTTIFYLQLALLAIFARFGGEIARRLRLPVVIGEIVAGVILGPTIFQQVLPGWYNAVFPHSGSNAIVLAGITGLGATLFLLAAGLEVDLPLVGQQGWHAVVISLAGIAVPFTIGFLSAVSFPNFFTPHPAEHPTVFAIFLGVALSLTALPVTARILLDLNLFRTSFGMLIIAAAVLDDLLGWIIFGVVLAFDHLHDAGKFTPDKIAVMATLTLAFVGLMLTIGRRGADWLLKSLNRLHIRAGGIIGFTLAFALFGAAFTQWLGIHGFFGAFIVGVAIGTSANFPKETREAIEGVVNNFLAPIFFASVGLSVNFVANFWLPLVVSILAIACIGKIGGCVLAARVQGIPWARCWAVGFAMNARGGMEIILGLVALQEQIIEERMFVALALMAVVTSSLSGVLVKPLLARADSVDLHQVRTAA